MTRTSIEVAIALVAAAWMGWREGVYKKRVTRLMETFQDLSRGLKLEILCVKQERQAVRQRGVILKEICRIRTALGIPAKRKYVCRNQEPTEEKSKDGLRK
jgi:hypothetical protein